MTIKEKTDAFNALEVPERIKYLNSMEKKERDKFISDIRKRAVADFWNHEREAILKGESTRDWTPEQIENIMAISESSGKMSINAGKSFQITDDGVVLIDKAGKKSYYGHHMIDVSTHPEYAGDWRNVQALDYEEHYNGAHKEGTKVPTQAYYDYTDGTSKTIEIPEKGVDFSEVDVPPRIKCIFKSNAAMAELYEQFNSLTDGEMLALKNIDLSMQENGALKDFVRGLDVAERYNSPDFENKMGIMTDDAVCGKYSYLKGMDETDINTFKAYEYFKTRDVEDICIEKLGIRSDNSLLNKYSFMSSGDESLDMMRAYEYQNTKLGNTLADTMIYFDENGRVAGLSCFDDTLAGTSLYEVSLKDAGHYADDMDMTLRYAGYDTLGRLEQLKACQYDYERTQISSMVADGITTRDGITLKSMDELKMKYTWIDDATDSSVIRELQLAEYRDARYGTNTAADITLCFDESGKMSCIVDGGYRMNDMEDIRNNSTHIVKTSDMIEQSSNAHVSSVCQGFENLTDYQKLQIRQLETEAGKHNYDRLQNVFDAFGKEEGKQVHISLKEDGMVAGIDLSEVTGGTAMDVSKNSTVLNVSSDGNVKVQLKDTPDGTAWWKNQTDMLIKNESVTYVNGVPTKQLSNADSMLQRVGETDVHGKINNAIADIPTTNTDADSLIKNIVSGKTALIDVVEDISGNPSTGIGNKNLFGNVNISLSIIGLLGDGFDFADAGTTFIKAYGQYKGGDIEGASDTLGSWGMSTLGGMAGGTLAGVVVGAVTGPLGWAALLAAGVAGSFGGNWLWSELLDSLNDDYDSAGNAQPPRDPLVLDLGQLGIELTDIEDGVHFDLDRNGFAEKTAWIGKEDGFLVLDRNMDGIIGDGGELFGDQVDLKNGKTSVSGFEALAELDSNGDGVIDASDDMWESLKVWVDTNQDGSSQGELKSLTELGIQSISLEVTKEENVDTATGTMEAEYAIVTFEDGTQRRISEFWFPVDASDTTQGTGDGETVGTTGNVPNILVAMEKDETGTLRQLYEEFCMSDDFVEKRLLMKKIMYFVTGADDLGVNSRGGNMDARDLHVVEAFLGRTFSGVGGNNPNSNAASILKKLYTKIENIYFNILNADSVAGDCLDSVIIYDDKDGNPVIDLRLMNFYIESQISNGVNVDNLIYSVGVYLTEIDRIHGTDSFGSFENVCAGLSNHYVDIMEYAKSGNTYLGGTGSDYFGGTGSSDFVFGEKGNDTLRGGDGNDILHGGEGLDSIYGDYGNDILYGEDGNDTLRGGNGKDTLYGGADDDVLYGEAGNDMLYGEMGNDVLDGGAGDDLLDGGAGEDVYQFGRGYGRDTIQEDGGINTLRFLGLKAKDVRVNGIGQYDVAVTIRGTSDVLMIKDFRKGEEYQDWNLEFSDGNMHVTDAGSPFHFIYGSAGDDTLKAPVEGSLMYGYDGDDTILGSKGDDMIYGGNGNDTIAAGAGDDLVFDPAGNDTIDFGHGDDILCGGAGDDTYVFGKGYGTNLIDSTQGMTVIRLIGGLTMEDVSLGIIGENLVISLKDSADKIILQGYSGRPEDYIIQTDTEKTAVTDYLRGTTYIAGTQWNDYLPNDGRTDVSAGGSGDDFLLGTQEKDYLLGDSGNDRITAGTGDDVLSGGAGDDNLFGEAGNDVILGGSGNDYISGGEGNDSILGQTGDDFMDGGIGDDIYYYNVGDGKDSIMDSEGLNKIMFGEGIDASMIKAYRSNWNDLLITFDGLEDTLVIKNYCVDENARAFELVFADGTMMDAIAQDSPFRTIYGTEGSEYMPSIYNDGVVMYGGQSDDQLVGSAGRDLLYGDDGNDRITGNAGDDVLDGGTGSDYLYGGEGNDTYIFRKGYGTDVIGDGAGVNTINIYGYSAGQIKAYRTNWNDITITFAGSEDKLVIEGFFTSESNRNFNISFNGGYAFHATAQGSPLRTIYSAENGEYVVAMDDRGVTLNGGNGADGLNGGNGNDVLNGGGGDDRLCGNGGNDILNGGAGNDYLYGGAGNDTYQFNIGYGIDTVSDWEGINTLSFGSGLNAAELKATRINWNDLMITFDGIEDKLVIQGYFNSESNRNFNIQFADGTRYAYNDEKNPIKEIYAGESDDWMSAWSDKGIILHGAGGNDTLMGGAGDDSLYGDSGNDYLFGGAGNDTYHFGYGSGMDVIEDQSGENRVVLSDVNVDEVVFDKKNQSELVLSMKDGQDTLTIRNFTTEGYTFEFANGVEGTVDLETASFTRLVSEEEQVQTGVQMLSQLYEEEASTQMYTGMADQTDLQAMILAESMSAFGTEDNISDSIDIMENASTLDTNQLFVSNQIK